MKEVPSHHKFLDQAYAKQWAQSALIKRPERRKFFKAFVSEVLRLRKEKLSLLELGPGPGFLAEKLLENCSVSSYYLFDISRPMLNLSQSRLSRFSSQTVFIEGDFKTKNWSLSLPSDFDVVVSLQSVHELRHSAHIPRLYTQVYQLLAHGGLFLFCDHMNSLLPIEYQESHFMTVSEQLSTLNTVGFTAVKEILSARDMSLIRGCKS